jgi:hypothetical protein
MRESAQKRWVNFNQCGTCMGNRLKALPHTQPLCPEWAIMKATTTTLRISTGTDCPATSPTRPICGFHLTMARYIWFTCPLSILTRKAVSSMHFWSKI